MKQKLILYIVVAAILVAAGVWYWHNKKPAPAAPATTVVTPEKTGNSIGAVIFEKTKNPIEQSLPETNPLKQIIKNPF